MGWIPPEVSMHRSTASQQLPLAAAAQQNAAPEGPLEEEVGKLSRNEGKSVKISQPLLALIFFSGIQFLLSIIRRHATDWKEVAGLVASTLNLYKLFSKPQTEIIPSDCTDLEPLPISKATVPLHK